MQVFDKPGMIRVNRFEYLTAFAAVMIETIIRPDKERGFTGFSVNLLTGYHRFDKLKIR